jgi:hypothetical protein
MGGAGLELMGEAVCTRGRCEAGVTAFSSGHCYSRFLIGYAGNAAVLGSPVGVSLSSVCRPDWWHLATRGW